MNTASSMRFRCKWATVALAAGVVTLLSAIVFVGWVLHILADDNKALHRDRDTDAVVIQKLSTALDEARRYKSVTAPSSADVIKSVRSALPGSPASPRPSQVKALSDPLYASHQTWYVRPAKAQIISTGPLQ